MLHIFYDSADDNYLLIETTGSNTSFLYRNAAANNCCWLPLAEHLTSIPQPDSDPENFRAWKHNTNFTHIYSARTLSAIHKFIHNHPELSI